MKPRFASIDVGSNALRLRVVEAASRVGWREVTSTRAPVRLGRDVFATGRLSGRALIDASRALQSFRETMDREKVVAYRAVATSAVREARNGAALVERARQDARLELEVIDGIEEARLVQLAVTRHARLERPALLVDIGGGSTELTLLDRGETAFRSSLPLGTVRLLETCLGGGAVDRRAHTRLQGAIERAMRSAVPALEKLQGTLLVGTGGNVDALAQLCPGTGAARSVDVASARALFGSLSAMTPAARASAYALRPDRADTIVPACAILLHVAGALGAREIGAPGVGVKEGLLCELVDHHRDAQSSAGDAAAVLNGCRRLGRRLHWDEADEAHGEKVADLSVSLFDDLSEVHGLGRRDRVLLQAAALLHDVGDVVRHERHHKHSYYLILHSAISGLTHLERAIVANVARYHRKSAPDVRHDHFRELDENARARVRALAAILRIGDALDREHEGLVASVRATASNDRVRLAPSGAMSRERAWTVVAKAALFREVFGRELVVVPGVASGACAA